MSNLFRALHRDTKLSKRAINVIELVDTKIGKYATFFG